MVGHRRVPSKNVSSGKDHDLQAPHAPIFLPSPQEGPTTFSTLQSVAAVRIRHIQDRHHQNRAPASRKRSLKPLKMFPPRSAAAREIGLLLPNNQRQNRSLRIQNDVLPYALC